MKQVILLSGGLDSATCLAMAVEKAGVSNVAALMIYYGQKHAKELHCAKMLARFYGVEFHTLDLSVVFKDLNCPLIAGSDRAIEHKSYAEQIADGGGVSTYVPFRNGLILSAAASFAYGIFDEAEIYIGVHADDSAGDAYADCRADFIDTINQAIGIGTYGRIKIVAPFLGKTKADIVKAGLALKVPYELTWSCYEGGDSPCGTCATCLDRARAFALNNVADPALEEYDVHGKETN